MTPIDAAQRYFEAWNRRDPAGIVATLTENGTYTDPTTNGELTGQAIADYTAGLFASFPDLSFEVVSAASTGEGTVAAQWVMNGTNTGSFAGLPPTGRSVSLPGADFITVEGDKVRSVQGYFDQKTFVEQLGLQVMVRPYSIGPVSFGSSVYLQSGKGTKPGAFSLTVIEVGSDEEVAEVQQRGQAIFQQKAQLPGFITAVTAAVGRRLFTITAWEDAESPKPLLRGGAHKEAMDRFFGPDFAVGDMTSVWVPDRINAMWVRCTACGRMADYDKLEGKCQCGQPLPDHPAYW